MGSNIFVSGDGGQNRRAMRGLPEDPPGNHARFDIERNFRFEFERDRSLQFRGLLEREVQNSMADLGAGDRRGDRIGRCGAFLRQALSELVEGFGVAREFDGPGFAELDGFSRAGEQRASRAIRCDINS